MAFSENLKKLMEEKGETAYRLAKSINVSQTSISNWLNKKNTPHRSLLVMVADHYSVDPDELTK